MNRICLSDEILSEYLQGVLSKDDTELVEEHLSNCKECRTLISEASELTNSFDTRETLSNTLETIIKNKWLLICIVFFICSFIFYRYFFQLLLASALTGVKWIIDSKTTKMLITVYEAWKTQKRSEADQENSTLLKK